MRAIWIEKQSPAGPVTPDVRCVENCAEPNPPGAGEVLLATEFTALNHMDLWVGRGIPGVDIVYPHVGGVDAVARVIECGTGVDASWRGQRVLFNAAVAQPPRVVPAAPAGNPQLPEYHLIGEHSWGTHRERFVAPVTQLAAIGEFAGATACAFGLTALTAYGMMCSKGGLKPGQTVLITGIGGGVATAALALARHLGCPTAVTSRHAHKLEAARGIGAQCLVLDRGEDWSGEIRAWTRKRGVDMAVDTVGKSTHLWCVKSLTRGGAYVSAGATSGPAATTDLARLFWNQLRFFGSTMGTRAEFLEVVALLLAGRVEPVIDSVRPWSDAPAAWRRLEASEQMGKLVLDWR
jgi:NADPH:quinone reductase-like Zn-dependent oxidoreductase